MMNFNPFRRRKEAVKPPVALAKEQELYDLQMRSYAAAKGHRLTSDWRTSWATEDSELVADLVTLRARSRQMIRDNPHAFNLRRIIQNNVVGTGIGIQCQVAKADGTLDQELNDKIETAWEKWTEKDSCHTAGTLSFTDLLRLAIGNTFQDGEFLVRKIPQAFGKDNKIPFALEVIEPDLLFDEAYSNQLTIRGNSIRLGIEVDEWFRPVSYWLREHHPGDYNFITQPQGNRIRIIPAWQIEHLYLIERFPQTRGVPWLHAVLRRLRDMGGYVESELTAARAASNIVGFVKSEYVGDDPLALAEAKKKAGMEVNTEPGTIRRLLEGESFEGFSPSRPNTALDAFMRYMLREVAAGIGTSYESLSRDYSQSNYSSSRLALLDDRDLWRVLQGWLIKNFLTPLYREWLDAAVLSGVIDIPISEYIANKDRFQEVRFKPRGWSWVDPAKEVSAYTEAIQQGFMSYSDVVSAVGNGQDFEDVMRQMAKDKEIAAMYGFVPVSYNSQTKTVLVPDSVAEGMEEGNDQPDDQQNTDS